MNIRQRLKRNTAEDDSLYELLKQFLAEKSNPHTRAHYRSTLTPFVAALAADQILRAPDLSKSPWDDGEQRSVEFARKLFLAYRGDVTEDHDYELRTIWGILSDIRAFYKWLVEEKQLDGYPLRRGDIPNKPKEQLEAFTSDELKKLYDSTADKRDSYQIRDRAILCVLADCGLRRNELARLTVGDLRMDSAQIRVRAETAKNRKERFVSFKETAYEALERYLAKVRAGAKASDPLWQGARDPLGYDGLGQMLERLGKRAEVPRVSAHKFRRTCAVTMIRNGANVFEVKIHLGHESLQVLERYVKLVEADVKAAVEKYGCLDSIVGKRGIGKRKAA